MKTHTRFQSLCFAVLMVLFMVFGMVAYNSALEKGLTWFTFIETLKTMWPEAIVAFPLQRFVSGPLAMRLLPRLVDVPNAKPAFVSLCIGALTVFTMAPLMSLFATVWHSGLGDQTFLLWLRNLTRNFAFALFLQLFYVGPLVRLIHGGLFRARASA